jgi:hypothetical protein
MKNRFLIACLVALIIGAVIAFAMPVDAATAITP